MELDKYHLTKKNDRRLEKHESNRAVGKAPTKSEAMQKSMEYMNKKRGSMRVQREMKIQEKRNYPRSKDPKFSKG